MPFLGALGPAIGGIAGAAGGVISGLQGNKQKTTSSSWLDMAPESNIEGQTQAANKSLFQDLTNLQAAGPGTQDVTNSLGATQSLADMLKQMSETGGLPSQGDISSAQGIAGNLFAPQQTALNQSFITQTQGANQQAAALGRSVDDPILQAKLRTNLMNQQAQLSSQQGAYGTQLAMSLPQQRVQYAGQRADIMGNLATQAFQNRSALIGLGSNLLNNERQFRMNTATQNRSGEQTSGGGVGGALAGGLGGLGMGMNIGSMFGAGGGGNFGGAQGGSVGGDFGSTIGMSGGGMSPVASSPSSYGFGARVAGGGIGGILGGSESTFAPRTFNLASFQDAPSGGNASYLNGRNPLYSF